MPNWTRLKWEKVQRMLEKSTKKISIRPNILYIGVSVGPVNLSMAHFVNFFSYGCKMFHSQYVHVLRSCAEMMIHIHIKYRVGIIIQR